MGVLAAPLLFLLVLVLVTMEGSASLLQSSWRQAFVVDVAIPGSITSLTSANTLACGMACMHQSGCRAFGINSGSATCLLYNHLVEYTTSGTAAPETRYFWFLSPRCPTEQGYSLVAGYNVCLAKKSKTSFNNSKALCSTQGAHLYFANTARKIEALETWAAAAVPSPGALWMGAWDKDRTNDWRWLDGNAVTVWSGGMPSGVEVCMYFYLASSPPLMDASCGIGYAISALCEIPLI